MGRADDGATRATDQSSLHRYRTEIPNIVEDMDLSPYAFRLYVKLKRVAGDNGKCFYSTRELAAQCRMSVGGVSNAKQELIAADLIRVDNGGEWERDNITIVDMWPANFAYFAQEKEPSPCSPHEQAEGESVHHMNRPVHDMNASVHHMNTKEEPYKEITNKEEPKGGEGAKPPPAPTPDQDVEFGNGQTLNPKQSMYAAICDALGWDYKTIPRRRKVEVAEAVKVLIAAGYTAADIPRFMTDVWFRDWRWEKRQERPTVDLILQEIGKLRATAPDSATRASPASNGERNRQVVASVFAKLRAQQGRENPHG